MRKALIIFSSVFVFLVNSSLCNAGQLGTANINDIHHKIKSIFFAKCEADMDGASDAVCQCLTVKAEASLNDDALRKCRNDKNGIVCIANEMNLASTKALTADNLKACVKMASPVDGAPKPYNDGLNAADNDKNIQLPEERTGLMSADEN